MKPVGQRKLSDLMGKNLVVFDAEIKREIGKNGITWGDHHKMGISVACAFDYREWRFRVFMDDNMHQLVERLNEEGTLVVAFNQKGFDNKLLRMDEMLQESLAAIGMGTLSEEILNYDMLEESKRGANGMGPKKGFKLAEHLKAMNLPMKTDDGANAPIMYQEGRMGELIDYCLQDVKCEKMLFDRVYLTCEMASAFQPIPYKVKDPATMLDWN